VQQQSARRLLKAIADKKLFHARKTCVHTPSIRPACGLVHGGLANRSSTSTARRHYSTRPRKTGCASGHGLSRHDEVRKAIREQHPDRHPVSMDKLQWRAPTAGSTCRPALNYYLLSTGGGERKTTIQSRFINNVPCQHPEKTAPIPSSRVFWGGVTTSERTARDADVAEKFNVRVKITGGQRIDLSREEEQLRRWGETQQGRASYPATPTGRHFAR